MSKVLPQGMLRCLRGTTRPLVRSHSIAFHPTPSPFPTSRFASSSSSSSASSSKSGGIRATTVVLIFVPILTGILGIWQIQRLKWKVALIEEVDRNLEKEPMILPGNINMSALPDFAFRRVLLRGQFQGPPILLGPQVNTGVPGYNLILPFNRATAGGSTILLNRGFITTTRATAIRQGKEAAPGLTIDGEGTGEEVIVEGMLTKASDGGSWFTPKNDTEGNQWFWKDVVGMAAWCGGEEKGVQPVLVDAIDRGELGATLLMGQGVPVGRPPHVELRNQHATYAITWLSLSAATTVMLVVLLRKGRAPASKRAFGERLG